MKKIILFLSLAFITNSTYCSQYLVAALNNTIKIWDVSKPENKKLVNTLKGHKKTIWNIKFNPVNPNMFASSSEDNTIRIWETKSGNWGDAICIKKLGAHNGKGKSLSFSKDGKYLAFSLGNKTAKIVDTENWKSIKKITGTTEQPNSLAFLPVITPGFTFIGYCTGERTVPIIDIKNGTVAVEITVDTPDSLKSIFFENEGYLAAITTTHDLIIWNVTQDKNDKTAGKSPEGGTFSLLGFNPKNSDILLSILYRQSPPNMLEISNWKSSKYLAFGRQTSTTAATFNPDKPNMLATGYDSGVILIVADINLSLDEEDQKKLKTFIIADKSKNKVSALAFGPVTETKSVKRFKKKLMEARKKKRIAAPDIEIKFKK